MSVSGAAAYEYAGGHRAGLISWGLGAAGAAGAGLPARPGAGLGLAGLVVVLVGLDQGVEDPVLLEYSIGWLTCTVATGWTR